MVCKITLLVKFEYDNLVKNTKINQNASTLCIYYSLSTAPIEMVRPKLYTLLLSVTDLETPSFT